ncbi:Mediator complex subunit 24 [Aphelenchoides bicaudatus]|nr:Mediator complex subunit 24 [Aphelenchoides bicaudatus]
MEVDPVEKSPASSTSSFDFLPELMGPLKQVVFECFTNEDDPVQFIGKFNGLLNEGLVSVNQNPEAIIQALIEIGCAKNGTNALLMPYLDTLWECKYFDYIQYIKTLISYRNLDKPQCVLSFITKIGQLLKRIDCDFRDDKLVYEMCDIFMFVLKWYSDLLSAIFSQRREDAIFLVKAIEKHIGFFGEDHFARYVAFCVSFIDPDIFQQLHDQLFATCEQMHEMSKNVYIPKETKELMEQLPGFIKSLSTKPEFQVQYTDTYRFGYNQPRPAILSLVTVYSVFRVLSTNEEVADALINIGNINLMSKVQILTDLFRGTFLILLDYHEADEVSADQHRDIHTLVLTEIFAYKRLASIVELLLETGQCTTDQLIEALTKLASNSVLLNALDRRQLDNTLASIINNSRIPQFLGNEYYKKIMELRMHSMEKDTELFYLLYKNQNLDQDQRSRYYQFTKANAIAQKMQESPETIDQLIVELIDQAELMQIDLVLACLCADEQIKSFSAKLSSFILSLEHTGNDDNTLRNQTFDSAFLLLTRIRQLFSDLRLEEITDGNTDSTFYKWTEKLYDYLEQNHALPINEEIKQSTFVAHFSRLKLGQAFWNNTWDFSKLLDHAPAVGEAVLDEVVSENKVDDESLKSILKTFGDTSCMFICLCQWLETNPPSEHLQMLATSLAECGR